MGNFTIKPIIMSWRSRKDGKSPVAIRATINRIPRYYPVKNQGDTLYLSKREFRNAQQNASDEVSQEHAKLIEATVRMVTAQLMPKQIEKEKDESKKAKSLNRLFRDKATALYRDGFSFSTVQLYWSALESFVNFAGVDATSEMFDNEAIKKYERWMLNQDYSPTTIAIYVRNLRTAIKFGGDEVKFTKSVVGRSSTRKIAVDKDKIKSFLTYKSDDKRLERARDMFIFSYLNGGMNTKDMAMLRWSEVHEDRLQFSRAKRHNTDPIMITHPLNDVTKSIIDKWGVKSTRFVFGVLTGDEDEVRIRKVTNQFTKTINKYLKRVADELEIGVKVTTYVARHSFATILKRSGVDLALISEMLGHSDIRTTKHYLDSFELEQTKAAARNLL